MSTAAAYTTSAPHRHLGHAGRMGITRCLQHWGQPPSSRQAVLQGCMVAETTQANPHLGELSSKRLQRARNVPQHHRGRPVARGELCQGTG
jgi:hypothetical protein